MFYNSTNNSELAAENMTSEMTGWYIADHPLGMLIVSRVFIRGLIISFTEENQ